MLPENPHVELLGVRLDLVDWPQVERFCVEVLRQNQPKQVVTLHGEMVLMAKNNNRLKNAINKADLVIPDATNVVWAARLKGHKLPERTPGNELVERLAKLSAEKGYSVFLLGSRPGIAVQTGERLQKRYPGLKIAGSSAADPDNPDIVAEIAQSRADIVLVAYGTPTQEIWIDENKEKSSAKLLVGVGGTFDMLSGRLPRTPNFMRSLSLEWLWRLMIEPTRFKRAWRSVVVFPLQILFS